LTYLRRKKEPESLPLPRPTYAGRRLVERPQFGKSVFWSVPSDTNGGHGPPFDPLCHRMIAVSPSAEE